MSKLPSDLSSVTTVAVDLAKHVFQVHGCDVSGKVIVAKALRRKDVLPFFASLGPCLGGARMCCRSSRRSALALAAWRRAGLRIIGDVN